jgi:hypothetical protein
MGMLGLHRNTSLIKLRFNYIILPFSTLFYLVGLQPFSIRIMLMLHAQDQCFLTQLFHSIVSNNESRFIFYDMFMRKKTRINHFNLFIAQVFLPVKLSLPCFSFQRWFIFITSTINQNFQTNKALGLP